MDRLNIEFLENYKKLDALLKDVFSSREGISAYISEMENKRIISEWPTFYKRLKHMRWLRNQLAHEYGTLDSQLCTNDDVEWIKKFYNDVFNTNDPLSIDRRLREEQRQRHYSRIQKQSQNNYAYNSSEQYEMQTKKKVSAWSRFISKLKKWFNS